MEADDDLGKADELVVRLVVEHAGGVREKTAKEAPPSPGVEDEEDVEEGVDVADAKTEADGDDQGLVVGEHQVVGQGAEDDPGGNGEAGHSGLTGKRISFNFVFFRCTSSISCHPHE